MAQPPEDLQVKTTSETAQAFIDAYYEALNRSLPLGPFYTSSSKAYSQPAASTNTPPRPPDISVNGAVLSQPSDYEALLKRQGRDARYDVESFDAHVANPRFVLAAPEGLSTPDHNRMSILIQVTGRLTVGAKAAAENSSAAGANSSGGAPAAGGATRTTRTTTGTTGTDSGSTTRAFNEVFVLVPNWDALMRNPPKGARRWLILSQNFRAL